MVHRSAACLVCLLAVVVCGLTMGADRRPPTKGAVAADWPEWRGRLRDGISTDRGLLDKWPTDGPELAWKAAGLGKGFSSVAIVGDRIFTMGDRDTGQFVMALRLADGKELWSTRIGDIWEPRGYSGPRCTPTIDGKMLYVVSPHGELVALAVDSGKEIWRRLLHDDFGGPVPNWGFSESPLVDGNKLLCTPGGPDAGMVALNKTSGTEIWRCAFPPLGDQGMDGAAYSSMVIGNGAGVRQYVQLTGRGVVGVAARDGKLLWGYNRVANRTASVPTPLVHDDYVFCSSGYQTGAALLKLKKSSGGGVSADEVYFLDGKQFQNHHGGMIMLGDYIYGGHGHNAGTPTCLEWKTGKIAWRHNRGPGTGSAALAYADGNLYFRFQNGVMALVGATPGDYEEKGRFQIPDVEQPSWSHPVIVGGKLFLREQDALLCYEIKE